MPKSDSVVLMSYINERWHPISWDDALPRAPV